MFRFQRFSLALALITAVVTSSAQGPGPKIDEPNNSILNRELFYELLVGELSARSGDSAAAYALLLDSARKTNAPNLYQRAVELALEARNGASALDAARLWSNVYPASQDANRYLLQILIGLNRLADTQDPLKRHLAALPTPQMTAVINLLPRYFARAADKQQAAKVVEQVLAAELSNSVSGPSAWSAIGLLRFQADDSVAALEAARRGLALNAAAEEPIYLALSVMDPKFPAAEELVAHHLSGKAAAPVRMAYVRKLLDAQRMADAYSQVVLITQNSPAFADAWLVRGSLEFQQHKLAQSEQSLTVYLPLGTATSDDQSTQPMGRGLVQAYLLLAQVAEQNQQLEQAKAYLKRIDSPKDALRVAMRQASILARQGKWEEARAAIRAVPEEQPQDERSKISAEVQLLREGKHYLAAYQLLADAMPRFPQDKDLVYDQAMIAEKLGKSDEMEQLLRRLIAEKPDYHHAYNALGFSLADRNVRLDEARQLVVKALELAPEDPFIVDSLAWVEFRSGNPDDALRLLKGAYQTRPDAEIAAHLGEVLWSLGQRDKALDIWKEGAEINPDNETLRETTERLQSKP